MSKAKAARRAAGLRKKAAASTALTAATYAWCWCDAWGSHPALVRLTDGLMVPCTHTPARRGEPACPMPHDWAGMGDTRTAWAKPLGADTYSRTSPLRPITDAAVTAAADAAFAAIR